MDRRAFLGQGAKTAVGAVLLGGGLPALLAACAKKSSSVSTDTTAAASPGGTTAPKDFGTLDYRMSWIFNSEFAGPYIADNKGYYKAEGFSSVNLIAGGPSASPIENDVATGKALVGISSPEITAPAIINGGLDLRIIGAQYQKSAFCIMSAATKPINVPQDLLGKKIGVQSTNESVWSAYLKANNLDASKITKVPVQFDPTPLTQGQVDGWFSFVTNEPVDLKFSHNFDTVTMVLADTGLPLVSEVYVVKADTIKNQRDKLKAFLRAEVKGWADNIKDPSLGGNLAANVYGKDNKLDAAEQTLESKAENDLIVSADTKANGLFTISDALVDKNIQALSSAGISITRDKLFDLSLIQEVYQEHPELKSLGS
jgi:ABC-type nitrate/sulfonate/bicarbonate transport system substrate-binding protein